MRIVKFGASWCQPCKMMEPHLATIAATKNVAVDDIDVDEVGSDVMDDWGISGVPTIFVLNEAGDVLKKHVGAIPPRKLLDIIPLCAT